MITSDEAAAIARERAGRNGWGLLEPLEVVHRRPWFGAGGRYEVRSDPTMRGTKAHFAIDAATGAILREGYVRR